jgi:hypothetical protein
VAGPRVAAALEGERTPQQSALPLDYREQVVACLARYADELSETASAHAGALYDEWVRLVLALARARLLGTPLRASVHDGDAVARDWAALLAEGERLRLDAAAGSPAFDGLRSHPASSGVMRLLLDGLAAFGARASEGPDGVVRELGSLHETLLGLHFERLASPARRLRRSHAWLCPAEVLSWAPNLRSKRLQRELALSKNAVHAFGPALARAASAAQVEASLESLFDPRVPARAAGRYVLHESGARRSSGAHYTPWALCETLVERTLEPLTRALPAPRSDGLLALRVCDPAMGAGAFLIAAARWLTRALLEAWRAEGQPTDADAERLARRQVVTSVLRGVDKNPGAVSLARLSLALFVGDASPAELTRSLRCGDALLGALPGDVRAPAGAALGLDWGASFPDVFERTRPGFDAIVGNPPWVAYVGRAAQPLEPAVAARYAETSPAFRGYRTLHGLFVHRTATLLRPGGRLGLVLPTSVADLAGYAPTRAAHDSLCRADADLPDWPDGAFDGVFQPCMALLSTREHTAAEPSGPGTWTLESGALGADERRLFERLARLPRLPRELFGERGYQTSEDDQAHLRRAPAAPSRALVPLREGADVGEFRALPPQLFADAAQLGARLRPASDWGAVKLLIRQTARFPMAALSDGAAFRNSLLAGFESDVFPAPLLLCLLNSSLLRWVHYTQQRDARQGMPQLKIGHLRALPAPPSNPALSETITALGARLGARNAGLSAADRAELDRLVCAAYELDAAERALVSAWASEHPPPVSRRAKAAPTIERPANPPRTEW